MTHAPRTGKIFRSGVKVYDAAMQGATFLKHSNETHVPYTTIVLFDAFHVAALMSNSGKQSPSFLRELFRNVENYGNFCYKVVSSPLLLLLRVNVSNDMKREPHSQFLERFIYILFCDSIISARTAFVHGGTT